MVDYQDLSKRIELLNNTFNEAISSLKSETTIDMNNRKAETRQISKRIDFELQDLNHDLLLKLSNMKTTIEAMKMKITTNVVWVAIGTFSSLLLLDWLVPIKKSSTTSVNAINATSTII